MESQHSVSLAVGTDPGLYGSDRDTFLRVWRRISPVDTPACPITTDVTATDPTVPPILPAPTLPASDRTGDDFPDPRDVPCLGSASANYASCLREFIESTLSCFRTYQILTKRTPPPASRQLSALAGEKRRHAKRLSTALFLITNVHYWPAEQTPPLPLTTFHGALRELFLAEQRLAGMYRTAADSCRDVCLRELFLTLSAECARHMCQILTLLENA